MATTIKTQPAETAKKRSASVPYQEPKRLSKYALWRKENPEGIGVVKDWRAVNR